MDGVTETRADRVFLPPLNRLMEGSSVNRVQQLGAGQSPSNAMCCMWPTTLRPASLVLASEKWTAEKDMFPLHRHLHQMPAESTPGEFRAAARVPLSFFSFEEVCNIIRSTYS